VHDRDGQPSAALHTLPDTTCLDRAAHEFAIRRYLFRHGSMAVGASSTFGLTPTVGYADPGLAPIVERFRSDAGRRTELPLGRLWEQDDLTYFRASTIDWL
jgi:hypothetical protein